ncbi:MAG: membrane-bound lytic murein transglycosylase MltF [Sulfurimonas sp.]|uniref:membrane-bound lytic murein transglycosylase MltF n=1 Tax=Sulfurimonas sp. TaxID=2022749 RepID=UPI0025E77E9A|nr:membrane-bound lytic murein transglycosylase MltF [Sulfurimonas sp.]MCK9492596.1 membrane-bound lytic murein transglycosylase MltF [Sulfurimonas sp.]
MIKNRVKFFIAILFFVIGLLAHNLYLELTKSKNITLLQKIKAKKTLDVIILNSPTVYYIGREKEHGFEYDLIASYAKEIGVDLNLSVVYTISEALEKTREGVGDITVASISKTPAIENEFKFGPKYFTVQEQLICHNAMYKTKSIPKSKKDLVGLDIVVEKETSYEATMEKLSQSIKGVEFSSTAEYSSEELLKLTNDRKMDCTVVDSNIFLISQRDYPNLIRTIILSERKNLSWILRDGDDSVSKSLYKWLNNYEYSTNMAKLKDHYYAHLGYADHYDTKMFYKRLKSRLPYYKKYFKKAGEDYEIPWQLLAAQSYQESHWDPKAKSYTGVRGMMMLTQSTAEQLGVKNRLSAKESIDAGARYLLDIEQRFPKEIEGSSRWSFALAAYNVGMGHIHDAQTLARKLNKNPYLWSDIKKILPLLSQKKYYKHLKYGYARGEEPVRYVESIEYYFDIMKKKELPLK